MNRPCIFEGGSRLVLRAPWAAQGLWHHGAMSTNGESESAKLAISWLLSDALEDIQLSTRQKESTSLSLVLLGDLPAHIHTLAELCRGLPAALLADESAAVERLRRVWGSATPPEREW